jgi:hypothetical protein
MPLHDPIPYDRVAELIGDAEPSQQSTVLHDAWREYAAKATRPYAWKTFAQYTRRQGIDAGARSLARGKEKLTPWQDGARASPRVLVLGAYAALRVRDGALEIEHGAHDDRQTIRIDIDAEPKPRAILFDSHGEFLTGEAIRWCARYSITLTLPGGPGRLITMIESALETNAKTMTRLRDIDPMIIRAQCAADPVKIAREIVRAKIGAELNATIPQGRRRVRCTRVAFVLCLAGILRHDRPSNRSLRCKTTSASTSQRGFDGLISQERAIRRGRIPENAPRASASFPPSESKQSLAKVAAGSRDLLFRTNVRSMTVSTSRACL